MSALDLSQNGPSITRSYKSLISLPPADKPSPTYANWALYSVSAPLQNAFVPVAGPGRDSVLKVQSTGEGELEELIEEFSEGKVQFAFVKVKDPNSGLGKFALIGWCGDGVPERVKGYFNGHLSAVSKLLHGYHVQITARHQDDLSPESILDKIAKASGANYAGAPAEIPKSSKPTPAPPVATKPLFPSRVVSAKPAVFRAYGNEGKVDEDGWGDDAPQVSRSKLESVPSAYTPTKVDIKALRAQPSGSSSYDRPEPVKGAYQPIGKVDIAEIRRKAGEQRDERPEPVKGAYQPIGKVDIAAIRAQARPAQEEREEVPPPKPVSERTAAFSQAERITALPKPKPAKKFGGAAPSFGTKPLTPGFTPPSVAPVAGASVDYASQGGKTPAQIWAEKKARERGYSGASETAPPAFQSASHTGRSQTSNDGGVSNLANRFSQQRIADPIESNPTGGSVSELRNKFAGIPVGGPSPQFTGRSASPPPPSPPISSRPNVGNAGVALPGFQQRQRSPSPVRQRSPSPEPVRARSPSPEPVRQRSPSPEPVREQSPVRIPVPVARPEPEEEERPSRSFASVVPQAYESAMGTTKAEPVVPLAAPTAGDLTAIAQYDYEKAEDNELDMTEGEIITHIDQVDDDWWEGTNSKGERGLFPANYVELQTSGVPAAPAQQQETQQAQPEPAQAQQPAAAAQKSGPTATAQYDYEAAEDNELSFPEGAKITDVEFPDEDWWSGSYNGKHGLFPANYVELDQ